MIEGVDVSSFQRTIDWPRVAAAGKSFVYVKDLEGLSPTANFAQQWAGARAAGLLRGAYDYLRPELDGGAQAKFFLNRLNGDPGELPPWLDVETLDGQPPSRVLDDVEAWIELVTAYAGRPAIYTGDWFWEKLRASAADRARADAISTRADLAVSGYGPASAPHVPTWPLARFWQYSGTGRCDGIAGNVDLDVFLGTAEDLRAYAAGWRRPGSVQSWEAGELDGPPEA